MSLPSATSRPCLLLVDDTPANLDVLVGLLKADFDLKLANRGAKALEICAASQRIDLILLDVMMPEMDGYEVCRVLRSTPATRHTPIIFLTARTEVDDVVSAFALGANDYVGKPFRPPELLARVRTQLMIQEQQREITARNAELAEMLRILCHDVANQFAVASLALEILKKHPDQDPGRFLPRISAAISNGIGLTNLVREIRRSEDKAIALQRVSLRAAVGEALLLVEDRARVKNVTVRAEVPDLAVLAEPASLINSVFCNLLTNAIKFSHEGSEIEVTGQEREGRACVTFRDHGIGMPAAVLALLFDVSKSHSRVGTAGEKGTGFGMPLMQKFVIQFGGQVEVVSRDIKDHPDDHGTEFSVWLNLADTD